MKTVFISGSMRIKNLHPKIKDRIEGITTNEFRVIVGDASGVDSSIQEHLKEKGYSNVTVFCSGNEVRNNIGRWPVEMIQVQGGQKNMRRFYTAKDLEMARYCNFGMMVWDSKSTGTLSNVYELLKRGKPSLVFINKYKEFKKVKTVDDFETLLSIMSQSALEKAYSKIQLRQKLNDLKEGSLFSPVA